MSDNSNLLYPLFNSIYSCARVIANRLNQLPMKINYEIDNTLHYEEINIPIGTSRNGTVYLNIGNNNPHSYIVGNTSSGKSNLIRVLLSSVINQYPNTQLILWDYKRCELNLFKGTKNCIDFKWSSDDISKGIDDLFELVLKRYDTITEQGLNQADYKMPTILVVIEEISLMDKKDFKKLKQIMAISRAVKVYFVLTVQRVSCDNLDSTCKSLISNRLVLRVEDKKNSMIALDSEGAEELRGNGHCIFKNGNKQIELQTYFISDEQVAEIISKHKRYETKSKPIATNKPKPTNDKLITDPQSVINAKPKTNKIDTKPTDKMNIDNSENNSNWWDNI